MTARLIGCVCIIAAALLPATAHAGGDLGASCTIEDNGGFRTVTLEVWNPTASAQSFELALDVRAGQTLWRSPVVSGDLAPQQRTSRTFRPFDRGVAITSCVVAPVGGDAGLAPGVSRPLVGRKPARVEHLGRGIAAYLVGLAVAAGGTLGGALLGARIGCDDCGDNAAGLIIGGYVGYTVGFPLGFAIAADHEGSSPGLGWAILGSVAGASLTVLAALSAGDLDNMWLPAIMLPQVGTIAAYYFTHRHISPGTTVPSALLELRDGELAIGAPVIWRQPSEGTTTVSLFAGQF